LLAQCRSCHIYQMAMMRKTWALHRMRVVEAKQARAVSGM
jgi:hypothetical protein